MLDEVTRIAVSKPFLDSKPLDGKTPIQMAIVILQTAWLRHGSTAIRLHLPIRRGLVNDKKVMLVRRYCDRIKDLLGRLKPVN